MLMEKIKANVIESIQNTEVPTTRVFSDDGRNHEDFNLTYKSQHDYPKSVYEDVPQRRFYETQNFKSTHGYEQ